MRSQTKTKYSLIATLYVSQAIPLGFFITAMPVILRDSGLSLESIGLFSAIAAPYLLKFLWAPAVDRYGSRKRHYLSWILPLQIVALSTVLAMSSLELSTQMTAILVLAAIFMFVAATQDIATDGLAVRALAEHERGPGNALQVGGYYLGQVLGGGMMLVLFSRFGWTTALWAMAALLALPLLPASRFREPTLQETAPRRFDFAALGRFFRRPGAWSWTAILLLFRSGETMATFSFNQMLVDLGLGLADIGLLSGVLYALGALSGSLLGGLLLPSLGRRVGLTAFALIQALAVLSYLIPASGFIGLPVVGGAVFTVAFAGGLATTALYTSMMDASRSETAGTDFTLQQSLCAVGPVIGTGLSGFSAAAFGFSGHFVLCAGVSLLALALVIRSSLPSEQPAVGLPVSPAATPPAATPPATS
ncbi:MAG: MFS transporter [Acidobacteriota bacterium]